MSYIKFRKGQLTRDYTIHFAVHQEVLLGIKLPTLSLPSILRGMDHSF